MRRKLFFIAVLATMFAACSPSADKVDLSQEHLTYATVWFQSSPDAKALFYQGFNIAKERAAEYSKQRGDKPQAVVVDLDETMIDNSPFQAKMIQEGKPFTQNFWEEWTMLGEAKATAGAVEFTHFCEALDITVIYLSNRRTNELESTMKNLEELGFAYVKPENFLLVEDTSNKEPRRLKVQEEYEIILLLGDNLNDFAAAFEERGEAGATPVVEDLKEEFGKRFIIFPNPMYGSWEKEIYKEGGKNPSEKSKFDLRRKALNPF